MDLTARYIAASREVIASVEAADVTNPDHPRPYIASLTTRATETLRTMSDHAERLAKKTKNLSDAAQILVEETDMLRARIRCLESENAELRTKLTA